jgi:hypothetical protein
VTTVAVTAQRADRELGDARRVGVEQLRAWAPAAGSNVAF